MKNKTWINPFNLERIDIVNRLYTCECIHSTNNYWMLTMCGYQRMLKRQRMGYNFFSGSDHCLISF